MTSSVKKEDIPFEEKRLFPRIQTECPVLYTIGTSKRWAVAKLVNFSATGVCLEMDEQLLKNISISVITKPGSNKLVPEITATGKVARCEAVGNSSFYIGCKLTKIRPS